MAWNIEVVTNALSLTKEQATKLVDLLESSWHEFGTYVDWIGEKPELIDFFCGEGLEFVDDFMEHRDYLHDDKMQAALLAVGAEGFVTFADFEGDQRGYAWTHTFKAGKYSYAFGKVRLLNDGRIPEVESAAPVPQIGMDEFVKVGFNQAPFNGNAFVITGDMATISRRLMEDVISRLGGRTHAPLSGKTFALIAGAEPGPAKMAKAKERGITIWDEETFLVQAGLKEAPAVVAVPEPVVATPTGDGFNTLGYKELHAAFERVVERFKGTVVDGLTTTGPKLEDGLPWFEVQFSGKKSGPLAKEFAQALAHEMNVRVLLNRAESGGGGVWAALGCFDFDPEFLDSERVPAYSSTSDAAEFMDDYGKPFLPSAPVEGKKVKETTDSVSAKTPYGWHFEEYHVDSGEVVRDGFSRTDVSGLKSKIAGFTYRITPVFTA